MVVSILQLDWTPATSSACCKVFVRVSPMLPPSVEPALCLSGKGGCGPLVKCLAYVVRSRCYGCVRQDVGVSRPCEGSVVHQAVEQAGGDGLRRPVAFNLVVAPKLDSSDDSHSWLAPLAHSLCPGAANHVYFVFDAPVTLSLIKVCAQ